MTSGWRIHRFALISGMGWAIDMSLFAGLVAAGLSPFPSNCISAATAVTFVFCIAQRRTFVHDGSLILRKFAAYAGYNVVGISLASLAVSFVAQLMLAVLGQHFGVRPADRVADLVPAIVLVSLAAKIAVTPITLYANFLFMGWLLEGRASFR